MRLLSMLVSALLGTGLAFAGDAEQVSGQMAEQAVTDGIPKGTASGYPPAGGKGPGSGHSYRQGTAGPGQGSPNYQGGRDTASPALDDSTTGDEAKNSVPVAPQSAGLYSNGNAPDSGYYPGRGHPYYGRGYGYGRYQRGYGYGYPGYRGLGGGRYKHHRQFGSPPLYPAQPAAIDPSVDAE